MSKISQSYRKIWKDSRSPVVEKRTTDVSFILMGLKTIHLVGKYNYVLSDRGRERQLINKADTIA